MVLGNQMNKIYISKQELQSVLKIIEENNVQGVVELIYNTDKMGSSLDVEFDYNLNGRLVTVRATVTDEGNW